MEHPWSPEVIPLTEKEFKELKEKAEKWDKLVEEDPDATIILSEVFEEAIEDLNLERDRVDAVRKYCEKALEETKDFPDKKIGVRKLIRPILKFLEAEG